ncbi:hypothetical protein [Bacillus sp. JJ1764]|uniref:hypothetical protein n=1 Tax=Bacillus sp. JJ1764 TaxID=3122964 RepID=UPI002FFF8B9A
MKKYYDLDKIHESIISNRFEADVLSMLQKNSLDDTIDYIKVSGICLNKYGKNKYQNRLKKLLDDLKRMVSDSETEKILDLEDEINLFQDLIDQNNQLMNKVMKFSFFESEDLLSNLLIMGQKMAGSMFMSTTMDSNRYESSIEAYSKVLWYVLFQKKSKLTDKISCDEDIENQMEKTIENAVIDFQLGNWIDDWQFAGTRIFKDKKKTKIRLSNDKLRVDIAKNRYLTTLEAKMARQTFESQFKNFLTEREMFEDLYLNYKNDIEFIKQFLNIENPQAIIDKTIGISLDDLCQIYFILKELAFQHILTFEEPMKLSDASVERNIPIYSFDEIHDFLVKKGIDEARIDRLIKLVMFTSSSESIFESPLIQIDKNRYTIIPQVTLTLNITSSIMRLMAKKSILGEKGYGYEKVFKNLVEENTNSRFINIKTKDENEIYELDGAFLIGKTLYLCEIKNFAHIICSYEYYKMRFKIDEAINQMIRISNFYTQKQNLNNLCNLLGINNEEVEQVEKIIIISSFLGESIEKNGVKVVEGILTRNFFKQTYPKIIESYKNQLLSNKTIKDFIPFENNGITDKNFNSLIKENPYLRVEKRRFKKDFKTYKPLNLSLQFNELKQQNISFKKIKV